jgi:hypothetical protein
MKYKVNIMIKSILIIMTALVSLSMLIAVFIMKHGINNNRHILKRVKIQSDTLSRDNK